METQKSFLEENKKWLILLLILIGLVLMGVASYYTIKTYSASKTSSTSTITPTITSKTTDFMSSTINILTSSNDNVNRQSNMNIARNMDVSGITDSPNPTDSNIPTLSPNQELMKRCSKALKMLIPEDIYSDFWCVDIYDIQGTNLNNRNIFCVIRKIFAKELNIQRNYLTYDDVMVLFENNELCEKLGAIILLDFIGRLSSGLLKYNREDDMWVFFHDKDGTGDYEKIFTWNDNTKKLHSYGKLYTEFNRMVINARNLSLLPGDEITSYPGSRSVPKKILNIIKDINPAELTSADLCKILGIEIVFNDDSINCTPCQTRPPPLSVATLAPED